MSSSLSSSVVVLYALAHEDSETFGGPNAYALNTLTNTDKNTNSISLAVLQEELPLRPADNRSLSWFSLSFIDGIGGSKPVWERLGEGSNSSSNSNNNRATIHTLNNNNNNNNKGNSKSSGQGVVVIRIVDPLFNRASSSNHKEPSALLAAAKKLIKLSSSSGSSASTTRPTPQRSSQPSNDSDLSTGDNSNISKDTRKVVATAVGSFASWAKRGINKGISQASELAATTVGTVGNMLVSGETFKVGNFNVTMQQKIADGGFSEVFMVSALPVDASPSDSSSPARVCALKRCLAQSKDSLSILEQEVALHRQVKQSNVMRVLAVSVLESKRVPNAKEVLILFPLYRAGSIQDVMHSEEVTSGCARWPLTEPVALRLALGACRGTQALHKAGFLHRDIKPHNILLSNMNLDESESIVMDLGSCARYPMISKTRRDASMLQDEAESMCSGPYRAPELYDVETGSAISTECDVWSLGCTFFAMTLGEGWSPFEDPMQGVLKLAVLSGTVRVPDNAHTAQFSSGLRELLLSMLQRQPSQRPTLGQVIKTLERLLQPYQ